MPDELGGVEHAETELTLLRRTSISTANECRTLQGFFQSTVPRILHRTVKGWATELFVLFLPLSFPSSLTLSIPPSHQ